MMIKDLDKMRYEDEAKFVLDDFPQETIDRLVSISWRIHNNDCRVSEVLNGLELPSLPQGWAMDISANCFLLRHSDGEPDFEGFWISEIFIEFMYPEKGVITAKKRVWQRPPLGYCSCGKKIGPLRRLIEIEKKFPEAGWIFKIWLNFERLLIALRINSSWKWQYAAMYNRHPECL